MLNLPVFQHLGALVTPKLSAVHVVLVLKNMTLKIRSADKTVSVENGLALEIGNLY